MQIFLNKYIFYSVWARLRRENSKFALETASAYLVGWRLNIVDVTNANTSLVELFILANRGGPPFLYLENRHLNLNLDSLGFWGFGAKFEKIKYKISNYLWSV